MELESMWTSPPSPCRAAQGSRGSPFSHSETCPGSLALTRNRSSDSHIRTLPEEMKPSKRSVPFDDTRSQDRERLRTRRVRRTGGADAERMGAAAGAAGGGWTGPFAGDIRE